MRFIQLLNWPAWTWSRPDLNVICSHLVRLSRRTVTLIFCQRCQDRVWSQEGVAGGGGTKPPVWSYELTHRLMTLVPVAEFVEEATFLWLWSMNWKCQLHIVKCVFISFSLHPEIVDARLYDTLVHASVLWDIWSKYFAQSAVSMTCCYDEDWGRFTCGCFYLRLVLDTQSLEAAII